MQTKTHWSAKKTTEFELWKQCLQSMVNVNRLGKLTISKMRAVTPSIFKTIPPEVIGVLSKLLSRVTKNHKILEHMHAALSATQNYEQLTRRTIAAYKQVETEYMAIVEIIDGLPAIKQKKVRAVSRKASKPKRVK